MPKPIATNVMQLHAWLETAAPETAALLTVGPDGFVYLTDDLILCATCRISNLDEDITGGYCEPCIIEANAEDAHREALTAMVRRL